MPKTLLSALAVAAFITSAGDAWAQQRSGLVGGVSLGGGVLGLHGTTDGDPAVALVRQEDDRVPVTGFDVHLGRMVSATTAVLFVMSADYDPGSESDLNVEVRVGGRQVTFNSSTTSLGSGVFAGVVQHWLTSNIWVRGGLGVGFLTRDFTLGTDASYLTITLDRGFGPAILAGAGVDVWRRTNFAADVEFHLTAVGLKGVGIYAPTVQVGFNWY